MTDSNEQNLPHISIIAQYIKDLSFESPNVPESLVRTSAPEIELSLDLLAKKLKEEDSYEVELTIEAKAMVEGTPIFLLELKYAGVFHLANFAEEDHDLVLAVHCPNMIFPFARKVIADVTQDGGFQPLMIDPINFGALYHKKLLENDAKE